MKKNYKFYAFLLAIPTAAFLFLGYSSGQTSPYSGSPGDSGNTCTICHSGSTNHNAEASITTNIPPTGYVVNQVYTVTVAVASDVTKHGFQITAEKAGGTKVGEFIAGIGNQVTNSGHYAITHTNAGNMQNSWSFTWTAPAINQGDITFYTAVNATNGNNSDSGDQVVTTSLTVAQSSLGLDKFNDIAIAVYPNPTTDNLSLTIPVNFVENASFRITNQLGKEVLRKNINSVETSINVSSLATGVYLLQLTSEKHSGTSRFIKK